jgi:hypothetical protein
MLFHRVPSFFFPTTSAHLQSNQTGIFYIILSAQEIQYKSLLNCYLQNPVGSPFSPVGGLPIHSPSINAGRATYGSASMQLFLFLCLIIVQVAGQAKWCWHYPGHRIHPPYGLVSTPTYTSSKESTTSFGTVYTEIRENICFLNTDQNPCPAGDKTVWVPIMARNSTTDSGYSTTFPTLSKATRTRVPCKYAPCTKSGTHECDPHPEDYCGNGRPYKRRTTSSALAQITSTEHLSQLVPGSTTSSIPHNFRCLNKLGNDQPLAPFPPKPTTTSSVTTTSSGSFWWWVYYMSLVNRPSKRSVTSSTLAQVNSTDNSLFYLGKILALTEFLDFLHQLLRIIKMASNDIDDSGNTPNSPEAPSKSDCEPQPADIITPYTDTDKNPLDDLGPNPESPVLRPVRGEDMNPDDPMLPRGQASDSPPKKSGLDAKPAPDSTPTKWCELSVQLQIPHRPGQSDLPVLLLNRQSHPRALLRSRHRSQSLRSATGVAKQASLDFARTVAI